LGEGIDQEFKVTIDTPIIRKMLVKHAFEHQQKIAPPRTDRFTELGECESG
jgi:hypothetical protein